MELHLGTSYARVWADSQVLSSLGGRTPVEALELGADPKIVWRAVHERLELPAKER